MRLAAVPVLLFAVSLLSACGGDSSRHPLASVVADAVAAPLPTDVVRVRLERAADGLLYTSESDYPFIWFHDAGPAPVPLTAAALLAAAHEPADEPVEVASLDGFFARHIERVDPYDPVAVALVPRYRHLRETIRLTVPGVRVFRVGRIRIRCYLVGTTEAGEVVGLSTVAIET